MIKQNIYINIIKNIKQRGTTERNYRKKTTQTNEQDPLGMQRCRSELNIAIVL
jgi:hypothetical protein